MGIDGINLCGFIVGSFNVTAASGVGQLAVEHLHIA